MTTEMQASHRTERPAQSRLARRAALRGGTAMLLVMAASGVHAQCAGPRSQLLANFPNIGLPTQAIGGSVQSLVSVLTTQNTASITQTSGFIGAPANPSENLQGGGVWVRGLGGTFDTNTPGSYSVNPSIFGAASTGPCNVRTFQDFSGFQAGADISRLNINGFNIHGGVTMGYTESSIRSNTGFQADFQTPFVGIYGAITKGSFFADGQVRWDFYQGLLNDRTNFLPAYNQRLDARSLSLTGNVGYQFSFDQGWFVEPSVGAVYSEAKVDTLQSGGNFFLAGNVNYGFPTTAKIRDFDSILARGSVRIGKTFVTDSYVLQPFITASIINEFGAPVQTDITTNLGTVGTALNDLRYSGLGIFDSRARLTTSRIGTYGQFSGGLAGQILNTGWLGYVRGDYRTGERVDGWGVSGGIRYQFNPELAARALISKGERPVLAAQDSPVYWTGLSAGVSAGGLWSQTNQTQADLNIAIFSQARPHAAGVYAGGQIGADYQFNRIVVGIAGDAGFANARGGRGCSPSGGFFYTCETNIDDLYMATARVGYAMDRSLFYVKGGGAFADTSERQKNNFNNQALTVGFTFPSSGVRTFSTGWAVGGGFEYAITKNWSAKAEYMHFELDRKNYAFPTPTNIAFTQAQHTGDIVKVGVNYRFTFDPPAPVAPPRAVIAKY